MSQELYDQIKSANLLESLVSEYGVALKKAGRNHKGLCPFHDERTASFQLIDLGHGSSERFYCHGCKAKGDVFDFVERTQGRTHIEARNWLAARLGIEVKPESDTERQRRAWRESALSMLEQVAVIWAEALQDGRGQSVVDYARARGVNRDTAISFRLGWSADHTSDRLRAIYKRDPEMAKQLGLVKQRGGLACMNRLVCPVVAPGGAVHGFSGRKLPGDDNQFRPKYWNSPTSDAYHKGSMLFGLPLARKAMLDTGRAVIVEGNFDVIAAHAIGQVTTVAPLGTALTDEQAALVPKDVIPVLAYDGDRAGRAATVAAIWIWLARGRIPLVARIPAGADPGKMIAGDEHTDPDPDRYERLIEAAGSAIDVLAGRWRRLADDDRQAAVQEIAKAAQLTKGAVLVDDVLRAGADAARCQMGLIRQVMADSKALRLVVESRSPLPPDESDMVLHLICMHLLARQGHDQPVQQLGTRLLGILTHPHTRALVDNIVQERALDDRIPPVVMDAIRSDIVRFDNVNTDFARPLDLAIRRREVMSQSGDLADVLAARAAKNHGDAK